MLFAHLAPSNAVGRIKRNGLRQGGGRRGRGVYCIPLFDIPRWSFRAEQEEEHFLLSTPSTSLTLWKGLFRYTRRKKDRPIAVLFRPPPGCWPADLYVELESDNAEPVLRGLDAALSAELTITEDVRSFVTSTARQGFGADLTVKVHGPAGVGLVVNQLVRAGGAAFHLFDETVELVFRRSVPARCIDRLIPLDRTVRAAREAKERAARDDRDDEA
ncbi:hypothetical protein [Polyangium jinanense]|uniref:Uncharacterized protein n=1 Tax=Polyangium jinanense TaxID=2829994 RepID=A0A9X3X345_9BACT|nr:hypothetical protein [Polyangium jinanense]MDC3955329.1 hypothetical protein [Polyangium jinanense]MDC3981630.1 hypothetical protein [Polyangium jinanense]